MKRVSFIQLVLLAFLSITTGLSEVTPASAMEDAPLDEEAGDAPKTVDAPPSFDELLTDDWIKGGGAKTKKRRTRKKKTAELQAKVQQQANHDRWDFYDQGEYEPPGPEAIEASGLTCRRLLHYSPTAKNLMDCGRRLYWSSDHKNARRCFELALSHGVADRGVVLARLAASHAALGDYEASYKALKAAVDAGFQAYAWINMSLELSELRARPEWGGWKATLIPAKQKSLAELNFSSDMVDFGMSGGSALCQKGRYVGALGESGRWHITAEGALVVLYERVCEVAEDHETVTCKDVKEETKWIVFKKPETDKLISFARGEAEAKTITDEEGMMSTTMLPHIQPSLSGCGKNN